MGCTPSIHVAQTRVVYCIRRESDPSPTHSVSGSGNLQLFNREGDVDSEGNRTTPNHFGINKVEPCSIELQSAKSWAAGSDVKLRGFTSSCSSIKALLVFSKEDSQCDALMWGCDKLKYSRNVIRNAERAVECFQQHTHNLVFIDARHSKCWDPKAVCRSIRDAKGGHYTVLIAIVKKSLLEREDCAAMALLSAGFDHVRAETVNLAVSMNELVQLEGSVRMRLKLRAADALLTAVEHSRDIVQVTDANKKILYCNSTQEHVLGFTSEDLCNRNVNEYQSSPPEAVNKQKEWEGRLYNKRKSGESISLLTKIIPVTLQHKWTDYYVYIKECPPLLPEREDMPQLPRGSIKSLRGMRKQSIAKHYNTNIEAPIMKVIGLISSAQEISPAYVQTVLDKALEVLRSKDIFQPNLNEDGKIEDAIAADLLEGLLATGPRLRTIGGGGGRRSSNESAYRALLPRASTASISLTAYLAIPPEIREVLKMEPSWEFDVIKLEAVSNKRPLLWLGMTIFRRFNVLELLGTEESTLHNWLMMMEANYHGINPYHNSTHAADVLHCTAYFLERQRVKEVIEPLDEAAALIAAAVHDVDHPGRNSAFLCNSGNELAILYNDMSVLESHHSAFFFKLTHSDDRVNILKGLDKDAYKQVRQTIVDMILATEMSKHFEHISKFTNVFSHSSAIREEDIEFGEGSRSPALIDSSVWSTPENMDILKRMLIKCADISNPVRPLHLCKEWASRISDEYFSQTDEEKEKGLPVVMHMFDRSTCSIPKSQLGFMDFFITDMFDAWDSFADTPILIEHMKVNYQYWKERVDKESSPAS